MKRFFYKLIFLLPVLIVIVSINFLVDPAHLYHSTEQKHYDLERKIADLLIQEENVTNVSNYNERILQKFYIENQDKLKDIVVIGSSRSMTIRSSLFANKKFFNNSVSGVMLEDYFAIYDLYRRKGQIPKEIILGVDPWIFNKNYPEGRWKPLKEYYVELKKVILDSHKQLDYKIRDFVPEHFIELFSLSYFRVSWNKLISKKSEDAFQVVSDIPQSARFLFNEKQTLLADGSRTWDRESLTKSKEKLRSEAVFFVSQRSTYGFDSFFNMDKNIKKDFEHFIFLLKKDGVKVTFFLPSYHPSSYDIMSRLSKYKMVLEVEYYLRQFSQKYNIDLLGSYNPNNLPIQEEDFIDGMHFKETAVQKIFQNRF